MAVYDYGNKHSQEAVEKINNNLAQIQTLYNECEDIAKEHGIDFSYTGPAGYGDGGHFYADGVEQWGEVCYWKPSSNSC